MFCLAKVSLFILWFLFVFFGVFSPVCFELSVPVQVIAWKDLSPVSFCVLGDTIA